MHVRATGRRKTTIDRPHEVVGHDIGLIILPSALLTELLLRTRVLISKTRRPLYIFFFCFVLADKLSSSFRVFRNDLFSRAIEPVTLKYRL